MLEDLTMDRKSSNRAFQNPIKGGIESKKPQDTASKLFLRQSHRREPSLNNASRSDQVRKPAPQKSKDFKKICLPIRRQSFATGKASSQVEECEYDLGSSFGNKTKNGNHLLNFNYERRGESGRPEPKPSHQYGVRQLMSTHKHKFKKEDFLQATFQFVIRADADYNQYLVDPDMLVKWDLIEQIIQATTIDPIECSICIDALVAPKITRCGHIFCYHCILHHLAVSDEPYNICPICKVAVYKNDLKSVQVKNNTSLNVGQEITFQLMARQRNTLIACPATQFEDRQNHTAVLSVSEKKLDTAFAKLLTATEDEVLAIVEKELQDLETAKGKAECSLELSFIEQAWELCTRRKLAIFDKANKTTTSPEKDCVESKKTSPEEDKLDAVDSTGTINESAFDNLTLDENEGNEAKAVEAATSNSTNRQHSDSLSSEPENWSLPTVTVEDMELPQPKGTRRFYFYQASDGQQIYLHAVNIKMLEMSYGSLEASPPILTGVVVEKESGSMTTELRKRLRYLQHLPVTAQFEVAEIELLPPVVTQETLSAFKEQLDKRRKLRQKKDKEERKREKKIAETQLRQMGRHPTPHIHIDSIHHFPQCGISDNMITPVAPRVASAESSRASSPSSQHSPSMDVGASIEHESSPTFAQTLRDGRFKGTCSWPTVGSKSPNQTSSSRHLEMIDSDGETARAPGFRQSFFNDALAATSPNISTEQDEKYYQGGKKKKKKKQKILFSTSMACMSK